MDNSLSPKTISQLLAQWYREDDEAFPATLPFVHEELCRLAHYSTRREGRDHTTQSTALVHEAHISPEKQGAAPCQDRTPFVAICAQRMRQILIEYARAHGAEGGCMLTLDDRVAFKRRSLDLIALGGALTELAKLDPQQSRIVELRSFGGLSIEEAANLLAISPANANRRWATARIWLHPQLSKGDA